MDFPLDRKYNTIEWAVRCFGAEREEAAKNQAWLQARAWQVRNMNVTGPVNQKVD